MSALFIILGVVGPTELILIIAIVLLLFGGKKIPELMKGLGNGMREFKKASQGDYDKDEDEEKKPATKNDNQLRQESECFFLNHRFQISLLSQWIPRFP